jgi:hypothetical protein
VDPASELTASVPNKVVESQEIREGPLNADVCLYCLPQRQMMRSPFFLQVGTCVSEGSYPAGTLSWHLDGKLLIPDGKGERQGTLHPTTFFLISLHTIMGV